MYKFKKYMFTRKFLLYIIIVVPVTVLIYKQRICQKKDKNIKYILYWTYGPQHEPLDLFGIGKAGFERFNCTFQNCFTTDDHNYFAGNLSQFDAILFHGRHTEDINRTEMSRINKMRCPHQKYVYVNMESAKSYPICNPAYDGFFNWTLTYRLKSDISVTYFTIVDIKGKVVGPRHGVKWITTVKSKLNENVIRKLGNKTKAAAWFASHCNVESGRDQFFKQLQSKLKSQYNLTVDAYGSCGNLSCPRENHSQCLGLIKRDYYFYLALENTIAKDYITEKVLHAMQNDAVPILFGGANYSKFLPPGSYLDGREYDIDALAEKINDLIHSPFEYHQYFQWKSHYTIGDGGVREAACSLCEMLNNKRKVEKHHTYENIRNWWLPDFKFQCSFQMYPYLGKVDIDDLEADY